MSLEITEQQIGGVTLGKLLGRIQIDFLRPGFKVDGYFRSILKFEGQEFLDKIFSAETHRNYATEQSLRQALKATAIGNPDDPESMALTETLKSIADEIPANPDKIIDYLVIIFFGMYQEDLKNDLSDI